MDNSKSKSITASSTTESITTTADEEVDLSFSEVAAAHLEELTIAIEDDLLLVGEPTSLDEAGLGITDANAIDELIAAFLRRVDVPNRNDALVLERARDAAARLRFSGSITPGIVSTGRPV